MNMNLEDKNLICVMDDFFKLRNDFIVIDVRNREERVDDGFIEGDLWFQLDNLYQNFQELEEFIDKKIVIYCRSGVRSLYAAKFLTENGFKDVKSLEGGIKFYYSYKNKK